jgi:predicted nucleic acid-binding protein
MILTPNNEYCVVLDACVLVPMPACDTLLRAAEEPSFFRIAWSEQILDEVRRTLSGPRFRYSTAQVERRAALMQRAFPEAMHSIPLGLIDGIAGLPDPNDRHVLALAIHAQANTIVTENTRHFPIEVLSQHHIIASTVDEFLTHQFHLEPQSMLDKLDRQAAGIHRRRSEVLEVLKKLAPGFCKLCS